MSAETPNRRGFFGFLAGCVAAPFVPVPKPPAVPSRHHLLVRRLGRWLHRNGVHLRAMPVYSGQPVGAGFSIDVRDYGMTPDQLAQFFSDHR